MIYASEAITKELVAPSRSVKGRVALYEGATLLNTLSYDDYVKSIKVERVGENGKYFGFGVCQKLELVLRDKDRELEITKNHSFMVEFSAGDSAFENYTPTFYVNDIKRDENTNELTITCYDAIYKSNSHTVSEIGLESYTIKEFSAECGNLIDASGVVCGKNNFVLNPVYTPTGVTTKVEGNTITATATQADTYIGIHLATMKLKKNTKYTVSGSIFPQNSNDSYISIRHSLDNNTFEYHGNTKTVSENVETTVSYTFDTGDYEYFRVALFITSSVSMTGSTIFKSLQVEEGEVASPYLHYLNIFDTNYPTGANFDGTETIREALNAIAEATQTIYYVDRNNQLIFKRLLRYGTDFRIGKAHYFTLKSEGVRTLGTITSATELGDNVSVTSGEGDTQIVRNNPFWDLREDINTLLATAKSAVGGLEIVPFNCVWRGNYLVEIGDSVRITKKDGSNFRTFLLNDSFIYNGGFSQTSQWSYNNTNIEIPSNPVTIGDAIKQTYARVDKVNKEIEIVASEAKSNSEKIASLEINTDSINATVSSLQETTNSTLENIDNNVAELTKKVEASITAEDVNLAIKSELSNGVDKVVTSTGFTFNEEGLTVSKTGREMTTTITEDGMTVYRDNTAVLTANHTGVDATNLHATTYLIIGNNSRFEDYGTNRTGCFWIGG